MRSSPTATDDSSSATEKNIPQTCSDGSARIFACLHRLYELSSANADYLSDEEFFFLGGGGFSVRVAPVRGALSHGYHGNCAY